MTKICTDITENSHMMSHNVFSTPIGEAGRPSCDGSRVGASQRGHLQWRKVVMRQCERAGFRLSYNLAYAGSTKGRKMFD